LGLRSPIRQQEIVQQRNKNSYLKISVTRDKVPVTEPITVSVDGEVIGSIEAGKNREGWPLGWSIKPGQREIVISETAQSIKQSEA
jgi:hypothetical protein